MTPHALITLLLLAAGIGTAADLSSRLNELVAAPAGARAAVGIHVVNLASGETLYAHNADQLYMPASNMKLFTAALALTRLGPEYRFETRVIREVSGDVVLLGSGDPSLSGRVYPYSADAPNADPLAGIEALADQMVTAAGLRRVDGNIVGDDRRYPWAPYPPSWTEDDILHAYGAPVSALTLNDNVLTIRVQPGARAGDLARVSIHPAVEYFALDNRVTTTANGTASVRFERLPGSRQVLLTGSIGLRSGGAEEILAVDDPARFAAQALYDALLRRGVAIHGRPVARHRATGPAPLPQGQVLATRTSPPLSEILQAIIKVSQNLHAELILREVGYARRAEGTQDAGFTELRAFLSEARISPLEWRTEDGSGLARNDEVTPAAINRLLRHMYASPHGAVWNSLFPIGGQDGTLDRRLCCTSDGSRVRAKTGTLSRAIALSGYADSRSNGKLAFSILVNNFAAPSSEVRDWVDKMALALVE